MATYKRQLRDKDGNTIYPDVGLELDEVIYGDDPGQVETPSPWIETGDIKDNQITSAKIADGTIATGDIANGAITNAKIAWNTATSAQSYTVGTGFAYDRGGVWRCGNVICVNMVLKCTQTQSGNAAAITISGVTFNQGNNSGFVVYEGSQYSMMTVKNGYAYYSNLIIQGVTADKYYLIQFVGIAIG